MWCWLLLVDPRVFRAPQPGRGPSGARRTGGGGGCALHEAFRGCVAGVSEHHVVQFPPRLVALRAWCWLVWRPQCRPPQQTPVNTGCCRRGGPRCGRNGACRGVLLAREPLNMRVNPLIRTSTPQHAPGRGRPRTSHRAHVRDVRPTCRSSGPRAGCQAHVQVIRPACRSSGPRAGHQARVQVIGPTCGMSGPRAGHQANVQVIRPTCAFKDPRAYGQADTRSRRPERWQRCCRTGITEQWSLVLATEPTYWRP